MNIFKSWRLRYDKDCHWMWTGRKRAISWGHQTSSSWKCFSLSKVLHSPLEGWPVPHSLSVQNRLPAGAACERIRISCCPAFFPPLPFRVVSRSTSLRNKRFRLVLEQRKTEERDFRVWPREKWNESQKMKEGGGEGEGKERNACRQTPRFWKPTFASERSAWLARLVEQYWLPFSPPPPRSFTCAIFRVVFDSRSSFFAPKPPTETLAIRRLALYARSALPSLRLLAW